MSNTQKAVFAGLALLLVLFVVVVGVGRTRPACTGSAAECARKNPPSAGMRSLAALFGAARGRIQLAQARYVLLPNRPTAIAVPPGDGLRTLKIALQSGAAVDLRYDDNAPDRLPRPRGEPAPEQKGRVPGDAASPDEPRSAAFTVSSAGGTLSATCLGGAACVLAQP